MKKLFAALAVTAAVCAAPARAGDVGVSISIGQPGFYGQIDLGNAGRPRLVNEQPVLIERRYRDLAPIYLRVPPGHQRNWARYCGQYDACSRPVYFVRDDWYRDVYAPRYRNDRDRGPERRDNPRDERRDERGGDHGDHGNGHGNGNGNGNGRDRDREDGR